MYKIVLVARHGATRFPGKVLSKISGISVLDCIIQRLSKVVDVDRFCCVATTVNNSDDSLAEYLGGSGIDVFRGSEKSVLERLVAYGSDNQLDFLVRLNCDNPFVDPFLVKRMLERFQAEDLDYLGNIVDTGFPLGLHVEIIRLQALETVLQNCGCQVCHEHVTPHIYNSSYFYCGVEDIAEDLSAYRFTVDYPHDLHIYEQMLADISANPVDVSYRDLINVSKSKSVYLAFHANWVRSSWINSSEK